MEREKAQHPVATMARVLGVSPAGFYAHRLRPRSLRSFADEILADRIRAIHSASRGTYGAPRIHADGAFRNALSLIPSSARGGYSDSVESEQLRRLWSLTPRTPESA